MHILIFGASGHVGTGLAEHLSTDHRITGVVRSHVEHTPPYTPVVLADWVENPQGVIDALRESGQPEVDAVIAAIGGWYVDGTMIGRGLASFDKDYASYLRGHFTACAVSETLARARNQARAEAADHDGTEVKLETRSGSKRLRHVALNGVASVEACQGSGAISVFGAAQEMLLRVAAAETESVIHRELKVMSPIGGDDRNDLSGGVETLSLSAVARTVNAILHRPAEHDLSTEIGAPG